MVDINTPDFAQNSLVGHYALPAKLRLLLASLNPLSISAKYSFHSHLGQ